VDDDLGRSLASRMEQVLGLTAQSPRLLLFRGQIAVQKRVEDGPGLEDAISILGANSDGFPRHLLLPADENSQFWPQASDKGSRHKFCKAMDPVEVPEKGSLFVGRSQRSSPLEPKFIAVQAGIPVAAIGVAGDDLDGQARGEVQDSHRPLSLDRACQMGAKALNLASHDGLIVTHCLFGQERENSC